MPTQPESNELQPGADRFWGEFSQSKAGRTGTGSETGPDDEGNGPDPAHEGGSGGQCLEWCPICRSAELFRSAVSPELRQQAESIQHEAMGVLKAFLDAYAETSIGASGPAAPESPASADHGEEPEATDRRVTDIPLD